LVDGWRGEGKKWIDRKGGTKEQGRRDQDWFLDDPESFGREQLLLIRWIEM
jgi:hypothetical protein